MSKSPQGGPREIAVNAAAAVSEVYDADVFIYAGSLLPLWDLQLEDKVDENKSRKNALLLLTTFGGSADAAYRIARYFQDVYEGGRFTVFVDTFCKSAGTLLAIGANELVMSNAAELGPLDVQMKKPDEIEERTSGLTATQSLSTLRKEAYEAFEEFFVRCRRRTRITSRIAADVAAQLAVGMFSPIYAQLEPMRIGENERAMLVANEYGERLAKRARNLQFKALNRLIGGYPSHEFSIERSEAQELFSAVRPPSDCETALARATRQVCLSQLFPEDGGDENPLIDCLSTKAIAQETTNDQPQPDGARGSLPGSEGESDGETEPFAGDEKTPVDSKNRPRPVGQRTKPIAAK